MHSLLRLETERLILRKPVIKDASELFYAYAQDLKVLKFLSWRAHRSIEDMENTLSGSIYGWITGSSCTWIIEEKKIAQPIGMVELRKDGYKGEIGYVLAYSTWGQGYATEALRTALQAIFQKTELTRISAICDIKNKASEGVMKKSGMQLEGTLRGFLKHPNYSDQPRDCFCYSILKEDAHLLASPHNS